LRKDSLPAASPTSSWTSREAYMLALICLMCGLALGYVARGPSATVAPATATSPAYASEASGENFRPPSANSDLSAAPLLVALKADPKNADLLIQLGNLFDDSRDYPHALEYYQRALEQRPSDVNVRTDMGTCYLYSGQPAKAIAEYRRALSYNPTHPQTLFNLGVALSESSRDYAGAIAAWEKLLKTNPDYPDKPRVTSLIEQAKTMRSQRPRLPQ